MYLKVVLKEVGDVGSNVEGVFDLKKENVIYHFCGNSSIFLIYRVPLAGGGINSELGLVDGG